MIACTTIQCLEDFKEFSFTTQKEASRYRVVPMGALNLDAIYRTLKQSRFHKVVAFR